MATTISDFNTNFNMKEIQNDLAVIDKEIYEEFGHRK